MKKRDSSRFRVIIVLLLFFAAAFLLPASRTGDVRLYLLAAAVPGSMILLLLLPSRFLGLDRPSLSAAIVLCGFGILAPAAVFPEHSLFQGIRCLAALFFLLAGVALVRALRPSVPAAVGIAVCSLALFLYPLTFSGKEFPAALGGSALLLVSVSVFLALRMRLAAVSVSLIGLLLLLLSDDLPSAAIWSISCVLVFWACSGSGLWSCIMLLSASGLFGGRIALIPLPGISSVEPAGAFLSVLPLLPPESMADSAVSGTDSLFVLLGKQYGLIVLLCAFLLLLFLLLRGASLSLQARKSFHASLALGAVLFFGLQTLFFMLAMIYTSPFFGSSFPLLTESVPDLCAQFFLLGLLSGISAQNESDLSDDAHLSMLSR